MTPAQHIVAAASAKGLTLTAAESCTGGMVCAAITDIAGSSAVFERGFVTYSNAAKIDMLGVDPKTLNDHGAVSEQTAAQMASGARNAANADIAVSITGIAGPGGSDHKPEGRVCFAVATRDTTTTQTHDFGPQGRAANRAQSTSVALDLVRAAIDSLPPKN